MFFSTLIEAFSDRASDQPSTSIGIGSVTLPAKMKVHGLCFISGQFNAAIIIEVTGLRAAKEFIVQGALSIYRIETLSSLVAHV